jgi:hypothetical protein
MADESKGTSATAGTNSQAYKRFVAALKADGIDMADYKEFPNASIIELMKEYQIGIKDQGLILKDFRKNFPLLTNTGTQLPVQPFSHALRCHAPLPPCLSLSVAVSPVCFVAGGGARPVAPSFRPLAVCLALLLSVVHCVPPSAPPLYFLLLTWLHVCILLCVRCVLLHVLSTAAWLFPVLVGPLSLSSCK